MSSRCASCSYPLSVSDSVVCYECSSYFHIDCAQLVGFPSYELSSDPNRNTFHCKTCELLPLPTRQCDSDSECGMPSRQLDYHLETQGDLSKDMNEIKGNIQDLSNLCKDMLREINEIKSINLTLRCCVENLRHENDERDTIISDLKLRLESLEGNNKSKNEKVFCVNKNVKTDSGANYNLEANIVDTNVNICMSGNNEEFQEPALEYQNKDEVCKPHEMKENRQDWTWRDRTAIEIEKEGEEISEETDEAQELELEVQSWELLSMEIESQRTLNQGLDFELKKSTERNSRDSVEPKLLRDDILEFDKPQQTLVHAEKDQTETESTNTLEESDEEETEPESEPETILSDEPKSVLCVNVNNVPVDETFVQDDEKALRIAEELIKRDFNEDEKENEDNFALPHKEMYEEDISAFNEHACIGTKSVCSTEDVMAKEMVEHDEQDKQLMENEDAMHHEPCGVKESADEVKEYHSERKLTNFEEEAAKAFDKEEIVQSQNVATLVTDQKFAEDEDKLSTQDGPTEPVNKEIRHEDLIEVEVGEIPEEGENEESLYRPEEENSKYHPENLEISYETEESTEPPAESDPLKEGETCTDEDLRLEEQRLEEPHVEGEERTESEPRLEGVPQVLVSEENDGVLEVDGEHRLGGQSQEEEVQPSEPSQSQQPHHTEEDLWHYLKEAVTSERPSTVEEFLQNLIGTLQQVPEEYLEPVVAANIKRANSPCSTDGDNQGTSDEIFVEQSEAENLESDSYSKAESKTVLEATESDEEVTQEVQEEVPKTEMNATSDSEGLSAVEGAFWFGGFWIVWLTCSVFAT